MEVISDTEMAAAMALHAETQYFHSDFAHTDFAAAGNMVKGAAIFFSSLPQHVPVQIWELGSARTHADLLTLAAPVWRAFLSGIYEVRRLCRTFAIARL